MAGQKKTARKFWLTGAAICAVLCAPWNIRFEGPFAETSYEEYRQDARVQTEVEHVILDIVGKAPVFRNNGTAYRYELERTGKDERPIRKAYLSETDLPVSHGEPAALEADWIGVVVSYGTFQEEDAYLSIPALGPWADGQTLDSYIEGMLKNQYREIFGSGDIRLSRAWFRYLLALLAILGLMVAADVLDSGTDVRKEKERPYGKFKE